MLKVYFEPDSDIYQRFEAKFGYTDFEADETYLGLTEDDFAADPYRRYAGSRYDNIQTEHYRRTAHSNDDGSYTSYRIYANGCANASIGGVNFNACAPEYMESF